jgi:hypothetical protein
MRVWWSKAIADTQGKTAAEFELYDAEWIAAVELITQFGAWNVDGVPVGDLLTDGVPMVVKTWVAEEVDEYVYPFLPARIKLRMRGIT